MLRSSILRILGPTTLIALATAAVGCSNDPALLDVAPVIVVPDNTPGKVDTGPPSAANASVAAERAARRGGGKK